MIHVHRPPNSAPKSLRDDSESRKDELERAAQHYRELGKRRAKGNDVGKKWTKKTKSSKSFKFKVYRSKDVRKTLFDLFHHKCAYCETPFAACTLAVEHYRPKSAYLDQRGELRWPGYWWLAADWDNLLPSCNECNGERRKEHVDIGVAKSGKGSHFPVANEKYRWRTPKGKPREQPLLIDPCHDDPEKHVWFDPARPEVILPKDNRGKRTIEILGLNRVVLCQARKSQVRAIQLTLKFAQSKLAAASSDVAAVDVRSDAVRELRSLHEPEESYSSMTRHVVDAAVAEPHRRR